MEATRIKISVPAGVDPARVMGERDRTLRALEKVSGADIVARGNDIQISGDAAPVELAARLIEYAIKEARAGRTLAPEDVERAWTVLADGGVDVAALRTDIILSHRGRAIRPKTLGQKRFVDAVRRDTITFCLGPAGTGKTYLAMALAVAALKRHEIGRIILTRPVVEAGENLGFLPGTLEEKIDPYMRPLYDALYDMMEHDRADELIERGIVEIAPLAYMRGRTLNDAFVILDEAQNTTPEQMKMFLTRLGFNSKFVITGDMTQRDLPGRRGGLTDIEKILGGVDDVSFIHLERGDVVRHALVGRIVAAFESYEDAHPARTYREGRAHGGSHQ